MRTEPVAEVAAPAPKPRRAKLSTLAKIAVAIVVLALVVQQAGGLNRVVLTLASETDWSWVVLGLVLATLAMIVNVCRWQLMLQGQGANVALLSLIRLYLVAMFVNNISPSRVGSDVVRAYAVSRTATSKTRSAAAVLMDRLVGAVSVLVLGMAAIVTRKSNLDEIYLRITVVFFVFGLVMLALMLYRNDELAGLRLRLLALTDVSLFGFKVRPRLEEALNALRTYSRSPGVVIRGFLISLVANGLSMFNLYLYAKAVRADVGIGDVATIAPFILFVGLLPISINGIGTIEATFVLLFGALGLDSHVALAIAVLRRLALIVLSLAGGVLLAFKRLE